MIPDQLGLDQEFSESSKFTINKFPPPSMLMSPDVLDLISSQMKQVKKAEFAHWNIFLTDHKAPADLDDVAVGTPGSAARRHEKKTVVPYRSYEVKESRAAFEDPPSPTTQCNKRVKISTNDPNFYGVKSGLEPLRKALTKIRGKKTAKVSSIKRE
ncbi:hypothetical protein F5876DRAFT_68403 [Lentinula aff. lateritia]|uniref:Uncharacterized protein n=1 Tax=Lentinula aff. lateritia TaxID=2804960 RepID=A0ACC1TQY1_9AGAR|nr:hypothetical protein F5876DRAFT_68403 [Lentinula aff. lateritia]